jgi:hypothetical protein
MTEELIATLLGVAIGLLVLFGFLWGFTTLRNALSVIGRVIKDIIYGAFIALAAFVALTVIGFGLTLGAELFYKIAA